MQLIMTATDRGRGTKGRKASSRLDREKVMPKGERPTSNPRPEAQPEGTTRGSAISRAES